MTKRDEETLLPESANVEGKLEARHINAWPHFLEAMVKVMVFGGSKPGREVNGWTRVGVSRQKCQDAEARHRLLEAKGELLDKESGYPHKWHRAANLLMEIESELSGKILP